MTDRKQRFQALVTLALQSFDRLTIHEFLILGQSVGRDLGVLDDFDPTMFDPPGLEPSASDRGPIAIDPDRAGRGETAGWIEPGTSTIDAPPRAAFLRWLICDDGVAALVDPRGFQISGAQFPCGLDLDGCAATRPIVFAGCEFGPGGATAKADLSLRAARMPALAIHRSAIGRIEATGLQSESTLEIVDCTIGTISAFDCTIGNLTIMNSALGGDGLPAVNFTNGRIGGLISLVAVSADAAILFTACRIGRVTIAASEVGALSFDGCTIESGFAIGSVDPAAVARLAAQAKDGLRVSDAAAGLRASGLVSLAGSRVDGDLSICSACLSGSAERFGSDPARYDALRLSGMTIGGRCILGMAGEPLVATANVALTASTIGGTLLVERLTITAEGSLDLTYARLLQGMTCSGFAGTLASIRLADAQAQGPVQFYRCSPLEIAAERFKGVALRLRRTEMLRLNLRFADLDLFEDDEISRDIKAGRLFASGLSVRTFMPDAEGTPAVDRIAWLMKQPIEERISPRPWLSLAAMFDALGHERQAKRVRYRCRAIDADHRFGFPFTIGAKAIARIRQVPFIIAWWILATTLAATIIFAIHRDDFIATRAATEVTETIGATHRTIATPKFAPPVYALENTLPVIKLGQDDKWTPDPRKPHSYWLLSGLRWFLILSGWFSAAILTYAVAQRLRD